MPTPFAAIEARINAVVSAKLANATATWNGSTAVDGTFDAAYVSPLDVTAAAAPRFVCPAASMSGVAYGDSLVIGGTTYAVVGIRPDGRGMVDLKLERS